MNPATQQVKRCIRLMIMRDILSQRPVTVREIAERFAVTERTVYRDLAELQAEPLRFPVVCEQLWAHMEVMSQLGQKVSLPLTTDDTSA